MEALDQTSKNVKRKPVRELSRGPQDPPVLVLLSGHKTLVAQHAARTYQKLRMRTRTQLISFLDQETQRHTQAMTGCRNLTADTSGLHIQVKIHSVPIIQAKGPPFIHRVLLSFWNEG